MRTKKTTAPLPLMQFIPALTPRYTAPEHLAPVVELFERATREPVRGLFSAPPRHEKSETVDHAVARMLLEDPRRRVGFATYGQRPAEKRGRRIRELYQRGGGRVQEDASSRTDWRTGADDGGLWATSIGGPVTGEGFDVFVIDDPVKDRVHAESAAERERLWDWFTDVAFTRLEPGGSCLVGAARWHPEDLIGRLERDGWQYANLPAIDGEGRPLLPARYPLAQLERIRETIGQYGWSSLYQGSPFARGGTLFEDVYFYDALPVGVHVRIRIGVDFAYTKKTKADYSVAVVLGEVDGTFYVLDVVRLQVIAPEFKRALDGLAVRYPGIRPFAFVGGTEKGVVDLMNSQGEIRIETEPATQDKFLRAQGVAAKWNAGKVLLPRSAPWLDAFVSELVGFTGAGDVHDDMVDALSGAYERARVGAERAREQAARQRQIAYLTDVFEVMESVTPAQKAALAAKERAKDLDRRVDDIRRAPPGELSSRQQKIEAERARANANWDTRLAKGDPDPT